MMTPLEIFRMVASEFATITDDTVNKWIELTTPFVSKKHFKNRYNQAIAFLTAHRMKLAEVGSDTGDDSINNEINAIGVGAMLKVASYSVGEVSINLRNSNLNSALDTNAGYSLTTYGIQYSLLSSHLVVPIISSGESMHF